MQVGTKFTNKRDGMTWEVVNVEFDMLPLTRKVMIWVVMKCGEMTLTVTPETLLDMKETGEIEING